MKYTRRITLTAVSLLILLSGCSNLFNMIFEPIQPIPPSGSVLTVVINDGSSGDSSRVITPLTTGLVYTVSLYKGKDDLKPAVKTNLTPSDSITFDSLEEEKEYIVRVLGETKEGLDVLSGETSFTSKQGENKVLVALSFIKNTGGKGSLFAEYELTQSVAAAFTAQLIPLQGGDALNFTETECVYTQADKKITLKKTDIPSGTYILALMFNSGRGVFYLNIDPIVEIISDCESRTVKMETVSVEDALKAGFTYYVADTGNPLVKELNNGFRPNIPITLNRAVELINTRSDITDSSPAKIVVIEDITVIPPESPSNAFVLQKSTILTSLGASPCSVTLGANCDNMFFAGTVSSIVFTLEHIILEGRLSTDEDNMVDPYDGSQNLITFDIPMYNAMSGLIKVLYGTVILGPGSIIQDNSTQGNGGGVFVCPDAVLKMNGGTIRNCTASMGGAVFVGGKIEALSGSITENSNWYSVLTLSEYVAAGGTEAEYSGYLEDTSFKNRNRPMGSAVYFLDLRQTVIDSSSTQWTQLVTSLTPICVNNMHSGTSCAGQIQGINTEALLLDSIKKAKNIGIYASIDSGFSETFTIANPIIIEGAYSLTKEGDRAPIKKNFINGSLFSISEGSIADFNGIAFTGQDLINTAGPLFSVINTHVYFNNCEFVSNTNTNGTGAGLYVTGSKSNVYVQNCGYQTLTAHKGGAAYIAGGECIFDNTSITTCTACADMIEGKGGSGGGIYIAGGDVRLTGSGTNGITNCTAQDASGTGGFGGAVYVGAEGLTGKLTLDNVTIGNSIYPNTAPSGSGGGVYVAAGGKINLKAASFADNTASFGNKLFVENYRLDAVLVNGTICSVFDALYDNFTAFGLTDANATNGVLYMGDGTSELTAYKISTAREFDGLRYIPTSGKYFSQTGVIDFTSYGNFTPIPEFKGHYDGGNNNGFYIKGLTIPVTEAGKSAALFLEVDDGDISNVLLENISITANFSPAASGMLAAHTSNTATITNCGTSGAITAGTGAVSCGGLVGWAENTTMTGCFSQGVITSSASYTGGLVGKMSNSTIENSYTFHNPYTAGTTAGALVGICEVSNIIKTSYSLTSALSASSGAGFIGQNTGTITHEVTYRNDAYSVTGTGVSAITSIPQASFKVQANFPGFTFSPSGPWTMVDGTTSPYFPWQGNANFDSLNLILK